MKAEDTVMTKDEMRIYCFKAYKDAFIDIASPFAIDMTCPPALCQAQAEISFKAGIKEVVEWIKERVFDITNPIPVGDSIYARFRKPLLQNEVKAKLKKWEIDGK